MNKTLIIIVILVIVGIGGYYALNNNNSNKIPTYTPPTASDTTNTPMPATKTQTSPTPTTPASNTTTTSVPASVSVNIKSLAFNPVTLTIKTGTKVTWTNNDSVPHTVTSDSGNLLQSPTLSPGQSFSFVFTTPGMSNYHCAIHTMMRGKVIVTN